MIAWLRRRYSLKETLLAILFLSPSIVVFSVFFYRPFLNLAHWGTFESRQGGASFRQAGLAPYREHLGSADFREGLWHTLQFILYTVPAGLVIGVLLAVAAHRQLRGIRVFRTIFSSTLASSTAVAAVIFFFLFSPTTGMFELDWSQEPDWLPRLISALPPGVEDLTDGLVNWAMFGPALPSIWQNAGLAFIIVLAGLQAIPEEVIEASRLDGYGPVRRLLRITLPLLSPVLLFLLVVLVIFGFQAFAQIELVTGGGPAGDTETLVFKIDRLSSPRRIGQGAVYSMGLFGVTFVATVLQFLFLERRVHYAN